MRLVSVAVPVPALDALTYAVPDHLPDAVSGARVLVPLGSRVVTGIALDTPEGSPQGEIKPIIDVLDPDAFLPPDVVRLLQWVAEYYACGVGEALAAAMPPRAWIESERHVRATPLGRQRTREEQGLRREILARLEGDAPVRLAALATRPGSYAALASLERAGLVEITRPLKGAASAFRTVRVARITAQGEEFVDSATGRLKPASTGEEGFPSSAPPSPVEAGFSRPVAVAGFSRPTLRLGGKQREALALLHFAPDGIDTSELAARGIGAATITRLAGLGLIGVDRRRVERDPFDAQADPRAVVRSEVALTAEQALALSRLRGLADADAFRCALVHGVTGSGKTEIYLRLAESVRARGRGVLLLVPEIALTPAVAALFRATFGERVAIQHSGLSDGERHDQWHRVRRGDVDVVVGTRSAVFAPVARLGLVVVDEEHDQSYKQEDTPRYHGRDVAVVRARQAGALVVLGSATPSMESAFNARNGRYELIVLEKRVLERSLPAVRIVDMREELAACGPDVVLSRPLTAAIEERLQHRQQAIVLLNRRGFATVVLCRQCGGTLECPNCSVSLTVHKAARRARCHYCNYAIPLPSTCVTCAGPYLEHVGFGTERIEAEIEALAPAARIARVDRDTVRRRGAIAGVLSRFAAGEIDILVGTQMIAKGHDFPNVTLVGVVSADVGLGMADFRAGERTFQLLTQVAGRAGRGERAGEAIIQTLFPGHYSIRHACRQDYAAFYRDELDFRTRMKYPPTVAMINAIVKASTREDAMTHAGEIVRALRRGGEVYRVLGPAPAPLSRLKGEYRAQFFVKGTHRAAMRTALLAALDARPEIRRRTIVDVDPMSVL